MIHAFLRVLAYVVGAITLQFAGGKFDLPFLLATLGAILALGLASWNLARPLTDASAWTVTIAYRLWETPMQTTTRDALFLTIAGTTLLVGALLVPARGAPKPRLVASPFLTAPVAAFMALAAWWIHLEAQASNLVVADSLKPAGAGLRVQVAVATIAIIAMLLLTVHAGFRMLTRRAKAPETSQPGDITA